MSEGVKVYVASHAIFADTFQKPVAIISIYGNMYELNFETIYSTE